MNPIKFVFDRIFAALTWAAIAMLVIMTRSHFYGCLLQVYIGFQHFLG